MDYKSLTYTKDMLHYQNITAVEEELDQVNQGLGSSAANTPPPVPAVIEVDREL